MYMWIYIYIYIYIYIHIRIHIHIIGVWGSGKAWFQVLQGASCAPPRETRGTTVVVHHRSFDAVSKVKHRSITPRNVEGCGSI